MPRFLELFAEVGVPATFYCVAEDLDIPGNAERVRQVAEAGHEVGNHTWHHPYDLIRLPPEERRAEVAEGRARLQHAAGVPVVGFRSPGYNTDAALQRDVVETGHVYDSSVFPCVPYYLAKATVMAGMRARGRKSLSVLGSPRVLFAPRRPYLANEANPHRADAAAARPLRQFPISVAGGVPLIGTAFTALGRLGAEAAVALGLRLQRHLTIEFHAADLLGLRDDGLDPVLAVQPDLKVGVARKRRIFRGVLERLSRAARVRRLDEVAA